MNNKNLTGKKMLLLPPNRPVDTSAQVQPPPRGQSPEYIVSKLVTHGYDLKGNLLLWVLWYGHRSSADTWKLAREPECKNLVGNYMCRHGLKPRNSRTNSPQ